MCTKKEAFFDYMADSRSCLERARKHLETFDETLTAASLFYAAFELRIGIEARLHEHIEAATRSRKGSRRRVKEYNAQKLLRTLTEVSPRAGVPATVVVAPKGSRGGVGFSYTPVTPKLAAAHGQLGTMMHFTFFRGKNKNDLFCKRRLKDQYGVMSFLDYRDWLVEVADELHKATQGTLLAPVFLDQLRALDSDE